MPHANKTRNVRTNVKERWISITGKITAATATNFEKSLAKLLAQNNTPIVVFLESPGGDALACITMYQRIASLVKKQVLVHTVGTAAVMSGAFFILQAGSRRLATRTTVFQFHNAVRIYGDRKMNSAALAKEIGELDAIDTAQVMIYAAHGCPVEKICDLFMRDAKIGTKAARELNLLDEVIPRSTFSRMRSRIMRSR